MIATRRGADPHAEATVKGKDDRRKVSRVVVDGLVGDVHRRGGGDRLTRTQVSGKTRVGAARHLDSDAVPSPKPLSGGPQRYPNG